jgi:hypothetical protein
MYACWKCEQIVNEDVEVCPYCGTGSPTLASGESATRANKSSGTRITLILGIVLTILWAVAWFALPWRISGSKPDAEIHARDALATIQEVLTAYRGSEGSFPASLDALGDRVRAAAHKAQTAHYTLQYTPGEPTADGLVKSYTLVARSRTFGYLKFYTDESGVFRVTSEDRAATVHDSPLKGNL